MNKKVIPIFMAFLVMGFGDVVGTLVGFAKKTFQISSAMAGLLPFLGFIAFGLLSIPCGLLQDKKGKKYTLVIGLLIALTGLIIPIISLSQYLFLIISILLLGSGMAVLQVAGNPIIRDVSPPGKYSRNLTFAQFIKSVGSLSGSLLTALVVTQWTHLFPIYALAVIFTLLAVAWMKIDQTQETEKKGKTTLKENLSLLKNRYILLMVTAVFLYVGAEVGINSWIATYLNTYYGLDIESMATLGIGLFFFALMIGRLLGSIVLNWVSAPIFFIITSLTGIAGIVALFVGYKIVAIMAIFIIGIGFANIFPLIFSILIDHMPEKSNMLSGLLVMAIVGGAIMPLVMGVVADYSLKTSFLIPLASLFFITFCALKSQKKRQKNG